MKKLSNLILIAFIVILLIIAYRYISYRSSYAVSDAAFLRSDSLTTLSFKVGGKVIKLLKNEGDRVKKDELLAVIDDRDFLVQKRAFIKKIDSLKDNIRALKIKKEKIKNEIFLKIDIAKSKKSAFLSQIKALKSQIEALDINYQKLKKDSQRYKNLLSQQLIAKSTYETINSKTKALKKELVAKKDSLKALKYELENVEKSVKLAKNAKKSIKELEFSISSTTKQFQALKEQYQQIEDQIAYCRLYAPFDAKVAKKFISTNSLVKTGMPIYSIVNPKDLHIEVYLSEKKLKGVNVKNPVKITIDSFEDREYKGEVESILPASASTFSLVPRDIASGEFTKLDQRFIVRIKLLNPTDDLRVGMGASVAIKRKD